MLENLRQNIPGDTITPDEVKLFLRDPDTEWGWSIYLQNWVVLGVNAGKYTIH